MAIWVQRLSVVWVLISVVLVVLVLADVISKTTFQWTFASGFVIYAVVATGLNQIPSRPKQTGDTDSEKTER